MMMIQQQGVLHSSTDHNGRVNLYKINNMLQLIIWYICTHCTIIRLRKKTGNQAKLFNNDRTLYSPSKVAAYPNVFTLISLQYYLDIEHNGRYCSQQKWSLKTTDIRDHVLHHLMFRRR